MTCQACEYAKEHEHSGLYHANCPECQHRMFLQVMPLHLDNLKRTPGTEDRRAYLETVQRRHGERAVNALKAAYLEWWEARKCAK